MTADSDSAVFLCYSNTAGEGGDWTVINRKIIKIFIRCFCSHSYCAVGQLISQNNFKKAQTYI